MKVLVTGCITLLEDTYYIDHMKFAAYVAFFKSHFCMLFWFHFLSLYIWLYVLYAFDFVNHVFLLLCSCILIVKFMYSYCYVCSVLYILFSLCCSMYCLCVNVYCTTATGCQPNFS